MNIVVLTGGISTERDISIVTGVQVSEALKRNNHNVVLVDVFVGVRNSTVEKAFEKDWDYKKAAEELKKLTPKIDEIKKQRELEKKSFFGPNVLEICMMADVVFMALHGSNGEDGKVQATFDLLGIQYTGSGYLGSAIAMDKNISKELFNSNSIPTPKGGRVTKKDIKLPQDMYLKYPVIIKPACGGSSVGVVIADNDKEYMNAIEKTWEFEEEVVVEQYISGREFSVGIIEGYPLPVVEIIPEKGFYDYTNKYIKGKTKEICPAMIGENLTRELWECAVKVYTLLRLKAYARIDFVMDAQENIYCLEANTLPGMTPTSLLPQEAEAIGLSFDMLCEKLIEVSLMER